MSLLSPCRDGVCPVALRPPITLGEALRRFTHEAVQGLCNTGRYRCPYFSWGDGPPIVFIHGLSDTSRSFIMPMARLAEQFRCIAYDLPTGRADGARLQHYRHADLMDDLFALLDDLRVRQAYLFGSSFGSTITLAALHQCPARFPRAILQGGFAYRPLARAEVLLSRLARHWGWPLRRFPFREVLLAGEDYAPFRACPPEVWRYFLANSGATPMAAMALRAQLIHRLDLRPMLPHVRQPVLMVCGDCDPTVNRTCEQVLLEGLPNVGRVELPRCGHFPYFTHADALAEVLRDFLTPPAP